MRPQRAPSAAVCRVSAEVQNLRHTDFMANRIRSGGLVVDKSATGCIGWLFSAVAGCMRQSLKGNRLLHSLRQVLEPLGRPARDSIWRRRTGGTLGDAAQQRMGPSPVQKIRNQLTMLTARKLWPSQARVVTHSGFQPLPAWTLQRKIREDGVRNAEAPSKNVSCNIALGA